MSEKSEAVAGAEAEVDRLQLAVESARSSLRSVRAREAGIDPCGHCGSSDCEIEGGRVICRNCGVAGYFGFVGEAIAAWNRRTP